MHQLARLALGAVVLAAACSRPETQADAPNTSAAASGDVAPAPVGQSALALAAAVRDTTGNTLVVYKSPTCGCCKNWESHMREAGFKVVSIDTADVSPVKRDHGVTHDLASCHTALIAGYVIEGHVPAEDVKRLIAERPNVAGLAVPGMPMGSPGMEGPISQRYDVVAFGKDGKREVFAKH